MCSLLSQHATFVSMCSLGTTTSQCVWVSSNLVSPRMSIVYCIFPHTYVQASMRAGMRARTCARRMPMACLRRARGVLAACLRHANGCARSMPTAYLPHACKHAGARAHTHMHTQTQLTYEATYSHVAFTPIRGTGQRMPAVTGPGPSFVRSVQSGLNASRCRVRILLCWLSKTAKTAKT